MPRTEDGKFKTTLRGTHPSHDDSYNLVSSFAWIPTVFAVSEDGQSVSIDGYINGLGSRTQYPLVYKLLEQTFSVVMPLLERTVAHHFVVKPTPARKCSGDKASAGMLIPLVPGQTCDGRSAAAGRSGRTSPVKNGTLSARSRTSAEQRRTRKRRRQRNSSERTRRRSVRVLLPHLPRR
jgi:hypothetical protein